MLKLTTDTENGKETKNIDLSKSGWATLVIAFATAIAPIVVPIYSDSAVNKPKTKADNELKTNVQELEKEKFEFDKKLKEESQSLEKQKFQSELFHSYERARHD